MESTNCSLAKTYVFTIGQKFEVYGVHAICYEEMILVGRVFTV